MWDLERLKKLSGNADTNKKMLSESELNENIRRIKTQLKTIPTQHHSYNDLVFKLNEYTKLSKNLLEKKSSQETSTLSQNDEDDMQKDKEKYVSASDSDRKIDVPKEIFTSIDNRISELHASIKEFDTQTDFTTVYPVKQKAIDSLEFIKNKLQNKTAYAYKEAVIYFNSLMSPVMELMPGPLTKFIYAGKATE